VGYGVGTQQLFPFNSRDYHYSFSAIKFLLNYRFLEADPWKFEITADPGFYLARHQLINVYYVQPRHGEDYLEQRELLSRQKNITEYALDMGIIIRHQTFKNLSFFIQGGAGPMISNRYSERMAKGFAFSDIFAFGCSPEIGAMQFTIRTGFRHISNFNLKEPNSGYNAVLIELGISYHL
jgi:hypothetical protein